MINQNQILKSEIFGKGMLSQRDRFSKIFLQHIPVMITDNQKVVCLPNNNEASHIGFTAMTGKGKGICGNTLLGFEYWMKKRLCLILNDFQQETLENSLACRNKSFIDFNKVLGLKPLGHPIVYVYPSNKDLVIGDIENRFPHIKMSIPTRVIIRQIEDFYKLDKSAKYFTANIDRFLECKDIEEIDEALKEIIEENVESYKNKKSLENMLFKIRTVFKNIFDEEITDNASPDAPAFLTVNRKGFKNYNNLTVQALISTGLIPSIQTSWIRSKSWFSAYMAFIVNSIYKDKYEDPFFKDKFLSMYVPEIDKMWKGTHGTLIKAALGLIGTNGRRAGIALRWDTQNYDDVPDTIRSNTKHLFVLRKSDSKEVSGIKRDFNVDKEVENQILSLDTDPQKGMFECVALTTDRFILYDLRSGRTEITNNPQKGRLIPPISQHKNPAISINQLIKTR